MSESNVNVVVTYAGTTVEFKGSPEAVMESVLRFLAKEVPGLDLAKRISLNYPAPELIESYAEYIRITPEGPRVIAENKKLSDKDLIALQLVAQKVAGEIGAGAASLSAQELQATTALNPKSISSRLSELVKSGHVQKDSTEQGVKYKITTQGIHWLNSTLLKKARA